MNLNPFSTIKELRNEIAELREQAAEKDQAIERMAASLRQKTSAIDGLNEEIDELLHQRHELDREVSNLKHSLSSSPERPVSVARTQRIWTRIFRSGDNARVQQATKKDLDWLFEQGPQTWKHDADEVRARWPDSTVLVERNWDDGPFVSAAIADAVPRSCELFTTLEGAKAFPGSRTRLDGGVVGFNLRDLRLFEAAATCDAEFLLNLPETELDALREVAASFKDRPITGPHGRKTIGEAWEETGMRLGEAGPEKAAPTTQREPEQLPGE